MSTPSRLPGSKGNLKLISISKTDGQRYVFVYDQHTSSTLALRCTLARFASDPQLSFSWQDATLVRLKMKQLANPD